MTEVRSPQFPGKQPISIQQSEEAGKGKANWRWIAGGRDICKEKNNGAPGPIRTADTRFRRAVLYPLSYEGVVVPF